MPLEIEIYQFHPVHRFQPHAVAACIMVTIRKRIKILYYEKFIYYDAINTSVGSTSPLHLCVSGMPLCQSGQPLLEVACLYESS